jgi:hypothetical protein
MRAAAATRALAALALVALGAPGCGTDRPFSRGDDPPEEQRPDGGDRLPDGGEEPDGGGGDEAPRFRDHVMPILADCIACHAGGLGNFRITGDAAADHEATFAKVDLQEPEQSLVYTKATNLVTHGGGAFFAPDSASARTLLDWIRAGAKDD